jgi:hypothetical protein
MLDTKRSEMKVALLKIIMKIKYSLQKWNFLKITVFLDILSCSTVETYHTTRYSSQKMLTVIVFDVTI